MKHTYLQIFHQQTPQGWQPGNFRPKAVMHEEDAAAKNRHFQEHGILCVPEKDYAKFTDKKSININ